MWDTARIIIYTLFYTIGIEKRNDRGMLIKKRIIYNALVTIQFN